MNEIRNNAIHIDSVLKLIEQENSLKKIIIRNESNLQEISQRNQVF